MNTCHELASTIERLKPGASMREVARLCLMLSNYVDDVESLEDEATLIAAWKQVNIRMQATTDQHAAMTTELNDLSESIPKTFAMDEVMVLIRAIKVQSQVLQLYLGDEISAEGISPEEDVAHEAEEGFDEDFNCFDD